MTTPIHGNGRHTGDLPRIEMPPEPPWHTTPWSESTTYQGYVEDDGQELNSEMQEEGPAELEPEMMEAEPEEPQRLLHPDEVPPQTRGDFRKLERAMSKNVEDPNRPGYLLPPKFSRKAHKQHQIRLAEHHRATEEYRRQQKVAAFESERSLLIELLRWMANIPRLRPTIAVFNINGKASKTTLISYLFDLIAFYVHGFTMVIMAASRNSENATLGAINGIDPTRALSHAKLRQGIRGVGNQPPLYADFQSFGYDLPRTLRGVGLITEDSMVGNDPVGDPAQSEYSVDDMIQMLDVPHPHIDITGLDSGNDSVRGAQSVPREVMHRATVAIFTATAGRGMHATREKLLETMLLHLSDKDKMPYAGSDRFPGLRVSTEQKVKNSIVAMNAVPEGVDVDFGKLVPRGWDGHTLVTPFDDYIAGPDTAEPGFVIADCTKVSPEYHQELLRLAVYVYWTSAENLGINLADYNPRPEFAVYLGLGSVEHQVINRQLASEPAQNSIYNQVVAQHPETEWIV